MFIGCRRHQDRTPREDPAGYNIDTGDDLREAVGKLSSYVNGLPTAPKVVPLPGKAEG